MDDEQGRNVIFEVSIGNEDVDGYIHYLHVQEVGGDFYTKIGITEHFRVLFRTVDVLQFEGIIYPDKSFTIKPKKIS